jgi:hypothetical protein
MLRARIVLNDCRVALHWLEDDTEEVAFRIHWVGLCALLRAVGHVLQKIDGSISPVHRRTIDAHWEAWGACREEHAIFWDFIEGERNAVLKQYEVGYQERDVAVVALGKSGPEFHLLDVAIFKPMSSGTFAGEDARNVARGAITWWHTRLDEIEEEVERSGA